MNLPNKLRALQFNLKFDNWPLAIMHRLLFRREQLVVYRIKGVTFLVDFEGGDQCGTRECLVTDMYPRYFPFLPKHRPLTVLDFGGNGGGFPLSLLAAGFSLSECVSVEMNPNTFTRLQFNARYNARDSWQTVNAALAAESGFIELDDTMGSTSESMYVAPKSSPEKRVKVSLMTFDEVTSKYLGKKPDALIDICKMDVEGAEHDVFFSATCTALAQVKFLLVEIHPVGDLAKTTAQIESLGFGLVEGVKPTDDVYFFRNLRLQDDEN